MDNKIKVVVAEDIEILAIKMSSIIATNEKVEKVHYALNGEDAINNEFKCRFSFY